MPNISLNPYQTVQNPRGFLNGIEPGSMGNPINTIFSGAIDSFALNPIAGLDSILSNFSSFIPAGIPIQGIGNAIANVSKGFAEAFAKLGNIQNQIQSLIPSVSLDLTSAITSATGLPVTDIAKVTSFTSQFSESFKGSQDQLGSLIGGTNAQLGSVFNSVQLGGIPTSSITSQISNLQSLGPAMDAVQSVERLEKEIASLQGIANSNNNQQIVQQGNNIINQVKSLGGKIPSVTGTSVNVGRFR